MTNEERALEIYNDILRHYDELLQDYKSNPNDVATWAGMARGAYLMLEKLGLIESED